VLSSTQIVKHDPLSRVLEKFRSGASLHSHTMHSREYLGRFPGYIRQVPIASYLIEREIGQIHLYTGRIIDFRRIYWTPPLSAREALELEKLQIQRQFGLFPLVSLSDHDNIEAGLHLRMLQENSQVPISVEWTVPSDQTVFHLGVHNLPADRATFWMAELARYTKRPSTRFLRDLLYGLNREPSTLLVLNHPYWDAESVGREEHGDALVLFLKKFSHLIHALELNGLRSHAENRRVLELAVTFDLPVIAGGDRHGCEPNAVLNLSEAVTFAGFVDEIRYFRRSQIVLMPQFFDSLRLRLLDSAWHALSDAPGEFGRRHWMSRVFIEEQDGTVRPLSDFMGTRMQRFVDKFRWIMAFLTSPAARPAMRLALFGNEDGGL